MKNPLIVKIVNLLLLLLTFTGTCFAGSMSIPVSCSIPSVPGLNAPLTGSVVVDNNQGRNSVISEKNMLPQTPNGKITKKEPELLQTDTQNNKTLYPR